MNRPIAFCYGQGLCMVLDMVNLLSSVDNVVLTQASRNSVIAGLGFHKVIKCTIELHKDARGSDCRS